MKRQCVLAVDIGTSSVRASLLDESLTALNTVSRKRITGETIDAEACWQDVVNLMQELLAEGAHQVAAVGVSSQLAWVVVDAAGNPLFPALTWMDMSPEEMKELEYHLPQVEVYQKTARRMSAEFGGLKLRKLCKQYPEKMKHAAALLSLKDFINLKLTGKAAIDCTSACYTLLYNVGESRWDEDIVRALSLDMHLLPQLLPADAVVGVTLDHAEFPLEPGTPVVCSGPDGTVGVLGAGGTKAGVAVNIMGTTDVFFSCTDTLVRDGNQRLIVNPHVTGDLWVVGGPMALAGGTAGWAVETLLQGRFSYDEINRQAEEVPAGSEGLLFVPGLCGERAPIWEPSMMGTAVGLGLHHTAAHIFRAVMEGNSYTVRLLCEYCRDAGVDIGQIIAIGGATRHLAWPRIKADVTGIPVVVPPAMEATSAGCGMLAWKAAGLEATRETGLSREYLPNGDHTEIYQRAYHRYLELLEMAGAYYRQSKKEA